MGGPGVKLFPFSQQHLSSPLLAPSPLWLNHNHHHPAVHRTPSSSVVFVNSRSWTLVEKFALFSLFFVIPPYICPCWELATSKHRQDVFNGASPYPSTRIDVVSISSRRHLTIGSFCELAMASEEPRSDRIGEIATDRRCLDAPPQEECQEGYPVLSDGLRCIWHW